MSRFCRLIKRSLFFVLFFSYIFIAFEVVYAQGSTELEPIVITASLLEQSPKEVSQSVTVVTAEDIQKNKITSVAEALRLVPGVDLVSTGAPSDDLDIRIRGSDRDEVLVMLDGVPLNNLIDARVSLSHSIPVDFIERIEVLRGAQSVIYGSSAVGGVVNIITKTGTEDYQGAVGANAGNLQNFREHVWSLGKIKKHSFGLSFSRHDQKGRFDNDRFAGNSVFANYRFDISDAVDFKMSVMYLDQKQELAFATATSFISFPILTTYVTRDLDRFITKDIFVPQAVLSIKPADFWETRLSYGMYYEKQHLENSNQSDSLPASITDPLATLDSQIFDSTGHRHHFDLRNTAHVFDHDGFKSSLVFGVTGDLEYLEFTDAPFTGDTTTKTTSQFPNTAAGQDGSRRNVAGYAQAILSMQDRFYFSAGFRYDDNDTFGSAVSPRFSASYFVPKIHTKIFSTFSQGFIAPTINQYYLAVIGGTLTQRLDKEESQTFEVGFEQQPTSLGRLGDVSFGTTFFYTDYDTFINETQLITDAHVWGLENFIHYEPTTWLDLVLRYTYMKSVNDADGSALANRPDHRFLGELNVRPLENWTVTFNAQVVSSRVNPTVLSSTVGDFTVSQIDSDGNTAQARLPLYYTLGIASQYRQAIDRKWLKELRYSLRLNNLTNKSYQEKFGYPMPRFTFLAGVEARY